MSLLFYKVVHVAAVLFVIAALGGAAVRALAGATDDRSRKLPGITHGIALLLVLVTGFGALAKLGAGFPGWAIAKAAIWLFLGAAPVLVRKKPELATLWWWSLPLLGGVAGWLAIAKPF